MVLVAGTFLPWLRSGRVSRNSYQASGALQRLLALRGPLAVALSAWPFLALTAAVVVGLFAVGLRRTAAALGAFVAILAGGVAVAALRVGSRSLVAPATVGPQVTLFGAIFVVIAATLVLDSCR